MYVCMYVHMQQAVSTWSEDRMPEDAKPAADELLKHIDFYNTEEGRKYGPIAWRDVASCRAGTGLRQVAGMTAERFDQLEDLAAKQVCFVYFCFVWDYEFMCGEVLCVDIVCIYMYKLAQFFLCVCMYICIYVYIYIHTYMHTYIHTWS